MLWHSPPYCSVTGHPIAPDQDPQMESRFKVEQAPIKGFIGKKSSKPDEKGKTDKNKNFIYLCCSINNWSFFLERRVYTSKWNSSKVGFQVPSNISNAIPSVCLSWQIQIYTEIYWGESWNIQYILRLSPMFTLLNDCNSLTCHKGTIEMNPRNIYCFYLFIFSLSRKKGYQGGTQHLLLLQINNSMY